MCQTLIVFTACKTVTTCALQQLGIYHQIRLESSMRTKDLIVRILFSSIG